MSCVPDNQDAKGTLSSSEDAALEKILEEYYRDMSNRDWEKYRGYFWDDATITTAWKKPGESATRVHIITIDEFIVATPQGPDSQPVFSEKMKTASIHIRNNLADAWVEYDAEFGKPDSLMKWSGTDVFTFLRNEGKWKIVSLVFENN